LLCLLALLCATTFAQQPSVQSSDSAAQQPAPAPLAPPPPPSEAPAAAPATEPSPSPTPAATEPFAQPVQQPAAQPASQPAAQSATQPPSPPAPQKSAEPEKDAQGVFTFRTDVQEVTLAATVVDEHRHLVSTLSREAFQVFEDGKPQRISAFRRDDVPVALGIVIDNSGSMRSKRPSVNTAALNLVKASNPKDEVCIVNFNDQYYLDQDFTGNVDLLARALEHIEARGGTGLYDALVATSDHLMQSAHLKKRIILVVTDGEDTISSYNLDLTVRALSVNGGPTVYAIAILGAGEHKARKSLEIITRQTGGVAFFPSDLSQVEEISQQIARDIRNQYTISYKPPEAGPANGFHQVKVVARAPGEKKLQVRTRSGYYAGAASSPR